MQSLASETVEERTRKDLAHDRQDAEREFYRYEDTGLLHAAERTTNIVRFQQVCLICSSYDQRGSHTICQQKEHTFPLLFRVAMDVLPAQASSVASERIFSSSKETCTQQRNNISPTMLEALQILKFIYKQDRLNFTEDLVADERDYMISGPVTPRAVDELMGAGKFRKLNELLVNAREPNCD
jgi:hypothetical protein